MFGATLANYFSLVAIALRFTRLPIPIFSLNKPLFISLGETSPYIVMLGMTDICIDSAMTYSGEVKSERSEEKNNEFKARY